SPPLSMAHRQSRRGRRVDGLRGGDRVGGPRRGGGSRGGGGWGAPAGGGRRFWRWRRRGPERVVRPPPGRRKGFGGVTTPGCGGAGPRGRRSGRPGVMSCPPVGGRTDPHKRARGGAGA